MATSIVDSKALAMIAKWNGDKDSFKVWQFDILAYVGQHCPALREKMLQIPLNSNPVDVALLSADETKLNAQLFYAFTLVTEGAAKVTLMNCPYGNGLEFYRQVARMVQPVTKAHQRTTLLSLAEAKDLPASYRERVAQWETRITEYNRRADVDAEFPEDLKIATYQAKIAPESVREHLLLNESRLSTYKLMRDEVESVMLARDAQAPDDDSAMVIGSYEEKGEVLGALSERPGKGKSKGKKGKDKKGNKGGGRGDEGKDKQNRSGGPPPSARAGEYFDGNCNWRGRRGRKELHCFYKQQYDSTRHPGRIKDKDKDKGKNKGKDGDTEMNALEDAGVEARFIFALDDDDHGMVGSVTKVKTADG